MDFGLVYLSMVPVREWCSLSAAGRDIFKMSQDASEGLQDVIFVAIYKFKPDVLLGVTSGMPVFVDVPSTLIVSLVVAVLALHTLIVAGIVSSFVVAAIVSDRASLVVT